MFYIRISAKFDVDLCVTFLNFEVGSIWKDLMNAKTLHKLPVSSYNLIVLFSTSKSWTSEYKNASLICLHHVDCLKLSNKLKVMCLMNKLTPLVFHALSCNFTGRVSAFKSLSG